MAPPRPYDDEELIIPSQPRRSRSYNNQPVPVIHVDDRHSTMASTTTAAGAPPTTEKSRTEQRVGQYNIVRTLGEGSFGKVKLAVHRSTGQKVALKIIARKKLISRDMAGRVEREIEYLQLLRHPHIIKL